MSDNDGSDACITGNGPPPTLADGDTLDNYWMEGGACLLDTMTKDQVVYVLQRNPLARQDLKRLTSCQELLALLDEVPLLPTKQEDDRDMALLNRGDCLPFYTIFRGNLNNM